jgi:hypothetical protein
MHQHSAVLASLVATAERCYLAVTWIYFTCQLAATSGHVKMHRFFEKIEFGNSNRQIPTPSTASTILFDLLSSPFVIRRCRTCAASSLYRLNHTNEINNVHWSRCLLLELSPGAPCARLQGQRRKGIAR